MKYQILKANMGQYHWLLFMHDEFGPPNLLLVTLFCRGNQRQIIGTSCVCKKWTTTLESASGTRACGTYRPD
jgi:hypothetical protein